VTMRGIIVRRGDGSLKCVQCAGAALMVCLLAAQLNGPTAAAQTPAKSAPAFKIETAAFKPGGDIPAKYTCSGEDVSPALRWTDPPVATGHLTRVATKSFALIVEDPDAPSGTFVHWVVYNLPADARELSEGVDKGSDKIVGDARRGGGGRQGRNDFGMIGYGGPCPPPGKPHRYLFRLYYLDSILITPAGHTATKYEFEQGMKGHILAEAEVMGKFQR